MNNRKSFLLVGIICLAICGLALAGDIFEPTITNLNNDGSADFVDFGLFAKNWQQSGEDLAGDFDDSNTVDTDDLVVFCWYWLFGYSEYQQCQRADLDGDGVIAFEDVATFAQNWLVSGVGLAGDFDDSNIVDYNDLSIMAGCWLAGSRPEGIWEQFKAALAASDVNMSVSYFTEVSAENYRIFFEQVSSYLPQMAEEMGELIFIQQKDEIAYYDLLREEDGDTYAYPVLFVRDETGQWKIYEF